LQDLISKIIRAKWTGDVAQEIDHLQSPDFKTPVYKKKKKKKRLGHQAFI
jgi:hypothetical protein